MRKGYRQQLLALIEQQVEEGSGTDLVYPATLTGTERKIVHEVFVDFSVSVLYGLDYFELINSSTSISRARFTILARFHLDLLYTTRACSKFKVYLMHCMLSHSYSDCTACKGDVAFARHSTTCSVYS